MTDSAFLDLAPFHRDTSGVMWTSSGAWKTSTFGYTYPELIDWSTTSEELAHHVRRYLEEVYF